MEVRSVIMLDPALCTYVPCFRSFLPTSNKLVVLKRGMLHRSADNMHAGLIRRPSAPRTHPLSRRSMPRCPTGFGARYAPRALTETNQSRIYPILSASRCGFQARLSSEAETGRSPVQGWTAGTHKNGARGGGRVLSF
eukprot:6198934-Pleurochrysis_carterae.AAC.2